MTIAPPGNNRSVVATNALPGQRTSSRADEHAGAEFRRGWPTLLGATFGIAVGIIALPMPAIGIAMRAMQSEFGWTRAEISFGPTILAITLALSSPLLGWLADRVSSVWITFCSLLALASFFLLLSQLGGDLLTYYAAFAVAGIAGCGATTLCYARIVSARFVAGRGLALGIAMTGNGITSIALPILLAPYAANEGWRASFVALAILVAMSAPLVAFLIGRGPACASSTQPTRGSAEPSGASLRDALIDRAFWTMAICFTSISFAATGLSLHFLAFLADAHVEETRAGFIASLIGVALITGRLVTGWLMDRVFAPYVAAGMMAISAIFIASLGILGASVAPLGAFAIGLSIGAEIDLIGYLTSRYFGLRSFGRVYGLLYAAALMGSACSPVAYGLVVDMTSSYTIGLYAAAALLAFSALLFLTLRQFTADLEPSPHVEMRNPRYRH